MFDCCAVDACIFELFGYEFVYLAFDTVGVDLNVCLWLRLFVLIRCLFADLLYCRFSN